MVKSSSSVRWVPTLAFSALVAILGVHFSGEPEVPAGQPFTYVPPQGFNPVTLPANVNADNGVDKIWAEATAVSRIAPRVTLSHTTQETVLDGVALAPLADGLPALYAKSHGQWTEERHIVHVRPDGKRAGLIVGDLTTADDAHLKTMQMIFPDDTGTSIATASFDQVSAARLVPEFEKSLDDAMGLKKPGKKPENWLYFAYFFGATSFLIALQWIAARRAKP
jgi:hypothetical protein